jgi:hypothetical protein
LEKVGSLLQKIASAAPDTCGVPPTANLDPDEVELSILRATSDVVLQALNADNLEPNASRERAATVLRKIEQLSTQLNASWPKENRFHFQILDIAPALVLRAGIGTHEEYVVFGIPEMDGAGKANRLWQQIGEDNLELEHPVPRNWIRNWIQLYPLRRGPSGHARFLAAVGYTGCAGSSGVLYDAQEWDPSGLGELDQVIKQSGAFGMDEAATGGRPTRKDPFAPIGKLEVGGALIALPFCRFSAIDTWDNPSLCALDTYDLSGDTVKFRSRAFNRPDLLPIAKAIEYAENHDFPAARSYCANDEIAREIVETVPPFYFAGDLQVIREQPYRERVTTGMQNGSEFVVEKREGRWLVVKFKP